MDSNYGQQVGRIEFAGMSPTMASSSAALGGYQVPMTVATAPPVCVGDELKQIENALANLHQMAEALNNKLEPLMAPEGTSVEANSADRPERIGTSQIVLLLRSHRRSIDAAVSRLQRMLQRVEI